MHVTLLLWVSLGLGCGAGEDSGRTDGGAADGGAADGGAADGGAADGGTADGGTADGGGGGDGGGDGGGGDGGGDGGGGDGGGDVDGDGDGWSTGEGDCDDADDSVHPGAAEVCGDGRVNDCLAAVADAVALCMEGGDRPFAEADHLVVGDPGGRALGKGLLGVSDLTGDGRPDLVVTAPDGEAGAWILAGPLAEGVALADAAATLRLGASHAGLGGGEAMTSPGDVDGDGYADLWLGAAGATGSAGRNQGLALLYQGPLGGTLASGDAAATITGDAADDQLGWHLAGGELGGSRGAVVGAPGAGAGGRAAVFLGVPPRSATLDDADALVESAAAGALLGTRVAAAGDLDGDGLGDLVLGAPEASPSGQRTGAAYVLLAPLSGTIDAADADAVLAGEAAGDEAGGGLCAPGDVDGDGHADLWVGADERAVDSSGNGMVYLLSGPLDADRALAAATVRRHGNQVDDHLGWLISCGQDVDGDGAADLALGVAADDVGTATNAGTAALWLAPHLGVESHDEAELRVRGAANNSVVGNVVALSPDLSGDGWPDLAVGAPGTEGGAGAVGLYTGIAGY